MSSCIKGSNFVFSNASRKIAFRFSHESDSEESSCDRGVGFTLSFGSKSIKASWSDALSHPSGDSRLAHISEFRENCHSSSEAMHWAAHAADILCKADSFLNSPT
eukprot:892507_1